MAKTVATAPVVRQAAKDGLFSLPKGVSTASLFGKGGTAAKPGKPRGRIHPAFVSALVEAHPSKFTAPEPSAAAQRVVKTVEVPRRNAKGRLLKPAVLPIAEVRTLAGKPGSRGRLSAKDIAAASAALSAQASA